MLDFAKDLLFELKFAKDDFENRLDDLEMGKVGAKLLTPRS